jgi:hypothetical protein
MARFANRFIYLALLAAAVLARPVSLLMVAGSGSSCADNCGGHAGTCYCDDICTHYNDCCDDYTDYCSNSGSSFGSFSQTDTPAMSSFIALEEKSLLAAAVLARPVSLSMVGGSGSSCADNCGGHAGTCYCDDICTHYNDCCDDYTDYCSNSGSGFGSFSQTDTPATSSFIALEEKARVEETVDDMMSVTAAGRHQVSHIALVGGMVCCASIAILSVLGKKLQRRDYVVIGKVTAV